jgi:hypothetical protein
MLEAMQLYIILVPSLWISLAIYASWYFTSANRYEPLSKSEARALWEIHKQKAQCKERHWERLVQENKTVGFKCECGYEHAQKRPII